MKYYSYYDSFESFQNNNAVNNVDIQLKTELSVLYVLNDCRLLITWRQLNLEKNIFLLFSPNPRVPHLVSISTWTTDRRIPIRFNVILNHSCSTQVHMQGYKLINCGRTIKTNSWKIFEWSIFWRCFVCLFVFIERNTKSLVISKWRSKGIFVKVIQCTSISVSR